MLVARGEVLGRVVDVATRGAALSTLDHGDGPVPPFAAMAGKKDVRWTLVGNEADQALVAELERRTGLRGAALLRIALRALADRLGVETKADETKAA